MMSKGSKLRDAQGQVDIASVLEMLSHFKDRMGMISLEVVDLTRSLQILSKSFYHWEAAYVALQDSPAKPTKKPKHTAKPRTSTRQKVSS